MAHGGVDHGTNTKSTGYGLKSPTVSSSAGTTGTITKSDLGGYNSSTFGSPAKYATDNSSNGYSEMLSNLLPMMTVASMMFAGGGDNLNSVFSPYGGMGTSQPYGMGGNMTASNNQQQSFMMGFMMAMTMFQMLESFQNNQVTPHKTM